MCLGVPAPKAKPKLDISETEDGYVVFQPEFDRVHYLNHSAVLVLELCDGAHSGAQIAALVQQAYSLPEPPTAKVNELLDSLRQQGLLEMDSER